METDESVIASWFTGRLPQEWFSGQEFVIDREEIAVIGTLSVPAVGEAASEAERTALLEGAFQRFREETRERRVEIAREAEQRFRRKVSWGVSCEGRTVMFTTLSIPVMTRLRQQERRVLDTLVAAGVARSRSDALAWCVRLVGAHTDTWLADLRDALQQVDRVRSAGPDLNA
ncbi:hypothetical protein [Sphaerisporangium dianthi]|uniref:Smu12A n=1 Tax=Sphaerisporangium dianthi TaxID=1436120 RepID=A0ABV9CIX4_9ACTN